MYVPPAFREDRREVMEALMAAHPLATLISHGAGGLSANLIPMQVAGGMLRAHLARANPQLDDLRAGSEVLAVFQGPQAYVSPGWYATKAEHGRVVPTWNFLMVQVRGVARVIDDAGWLREQVAALTDRHEAGRAAPWAVTDAPERFLDAQLRAIVGIELPLDRIAGKWKASQNRPDVDRAGVISGLASEGNGMAGFIPPPEG